jgi:hypothetical protein
MKHKGLEQCVPDAMHTTKDVVVGIFYLISEREDTAKVEKTKLSRPHLNVDSTDGSLPYALKTEHLKEASSRLKEVKLPIHLDCNPGILFSKPSNLMTGSRLYLN